MLLKITIADLKEKNACQGGIEAFQKVFGDKAEIEWNREKQIEILEGPLGKYIGWAYHYELIPLWSLSRADLCGADLSRAYLSGANLSGADLYGADLSGANLSRANLCGADLSRADLSGANLSRANLCGADLSGANLCGADLSGAYLYGADLSRAYLYGADLCGADLSGANLSRALAFSDWKDIFQNFGWTIDQSSRLERIPTP